MPTLYTTLPGQPMGMLAAKHVLASVAPNELPNTLILVPTRRAIGLVRREFLQVNKGRAQMLPRILALSDIESELPTLCPEIVEAQSAIPPAMPEWQRLSLLIRQVLAFEHKRHGHVLMEHALELAQELAHLQDTAAQHGITVSPDKLRQLAHGEDTEHWRYALDFLSIISHHWPAIEQAYGMTTAANRQTQALTLLADAWRAKPPAYPIFVIGSTASQQPTAALMQIIADAPQGAVILPGLDPRIPNEEWESISAGHAYRHMKQFLSRWPLSLTEVQVLGDIKSSTLLLKALTSTNRVAQWRNASPIAPTDITHLKLLECAHDEEEVRIATILIREALETPEKRIALITPDENFMARVAAQLQRYGVTADRLSRGTLATTQTGSLWLALATAITEPGRMLAQFSLLQHPLVMNGDMEWYRWLSRSEPHFRGLMTHKPGQMPGMPEPLRMADSYQIAAKAIRNIADLSGDKQTASQWVVKLNEILKNLQAGEGEGAATIAEIMESVALADELGRLDSNAFAALLKHALSEPWRGGLYDTHPAISMLTPVEARLERFDRIVIANMRDDVWPGIAQPGPWLNFAHRRHLGLPEPEEQAGLMAHDLLMLGSSLEVFLTYARRNDGSPATRSRFVERLVTLLAVHGIAETAIQAPHYLQWAVALDTAEKYEPEPPAMPTPSAADRPQEIAVSALDHLFTDPYWLYARYVLKLKEGKAFDEQPEARDFGQLAHAAIEQLTQHWNSLARAATNEELSAFTEAALRKFSDRANIRLFWQKRLYRALVFVNAHELGRRAEIQEVKPEEIVKETIAIGNANLTLHGRIDRLEKDKKGAITIADYKTGKPPTAKDIENGKAVQLLAYALMLEASESCASIDYWGLPSGKREGAVSGLDAATIQSNQLIEKLRGALAEFMNPATPLLARPIPQSQQNRYENVYDGISRYDEWAE